MSLNIYSLTYLITSAFGTYIIYRLMNIFFYKRRVSLNLEFVSYMFYFITTSMIYLNISIPILNLVWNLILFWLLTFNYNASMKNRVGSTFFIYLILVSIESIIALLSGYLYDSIFSVNPLYASMVGMITIKVVSYIVVLFIENYRDIKKGLDIPTLYWLSIFFIPLGSLYIIIELLRNPNSNIYGSAGSIAILLTINIVAFYLYDVITKQYEYRVEKTILKEQNKSYQKQLEIMDNTNKNLKFLRHDLRNHLSIIGKYIDYEEKEKAIDYISQINKGFYKVKEFSNSGNINIDSILNYKLHEATEKGVSVSIESKIPYDLNISSLDMTIILGNLLDNAIEATCKLKDNKMISLKMEYKKGILFIHIMNRFNGNIIYKGDQIITSKENKEYHGIGLNNIKNVVEKYNGIMKINHTEDEFITDIMMYLD